MGALLSCAEPLLQRRQARPTAAPPARQRCTVHLGTEQPGKCPRLSSLPGGLSLHILGGLSARELSRLECSCRLFAAEDPVTGLPVPEHAAQQGVVRSSQEACLEVGRGPGDSWKCVLDLFDHGFFRGGVLHGFPVAALERTGWRCAYMEGYSHRTADEDLEKVPPEARFVFVGAREGRGNPEFALAAVAPRKVALSQTHGARFRGAATKTANLDRGVYWYRWPDHSFGFSSQEDLFLFFADCGIKRGVLEQRPEDRLSWNLETESTGGWRAGLALDLGSRPGAWLKCLYYRL
mmetsp:Transcript_118574/g.369358  ORF Transcript_118574/g.369358 Transcript_118574/m.369358 type:complete len:293 (+) Transcript_118574:69-947(+)